MSILKSYVTTRGRQKRFQNPNFPMLLTNQT